MSETKSMPSRRQILAGAAALTIAAPHIARAAAAPIKIGALNVYTKAGGVFGEAILENMKMYVEEHGGKIAGREVVFIKEDDEFNPQVALQKLRKLIESDQVDIIAGPLGSNIATAMAQYIKNKGTPWIITGAGATDLTKKRIPNMFRATLSNWQVAFPTGDWVARHVGKSAAIVASDYIAGHDVADAFKDSFTKAGGTIVKEIYTPVGTNDFSAYISQLASNPPPLTYAFFSGSESVRFVQQFDQFGLKGKSQLVGFQSLLDADTFPTQGASALGGLSSSIYAETLDTPENKAYLALYQSKRHKMPGVFDESGYTAMRIIADAAAAVGGDLSKKDDFLAAIAKTNIKAPRGPVSFDQVTHQAIQNIYIRKAEKQGDATRNVVIDTVANFGDYPPNRT